MKVRLSVKVVRDGTPVTSFEQIFESQADAMVLFHELKDARDKLVSKGDNDK